MQAADPATSGQRFPTGIPGLDPLLHGGLLVGGVYLLVGPPGAGKTVLANQIAFAVAQRDAQVVYLTILSETHTRLLASLRPFAYFDPTLVGHRITYVSDYEAYRTHGMEALVTLIQRTIRTQQAQLLVMDGLPLSEPGVPSNPALDDLLHRLQAWSELTGCTTLILAPENSSTWDSHSFLLMDGALQLHRQLAGQQVHRALEVRKFRGSAYLAGPHPFVITPDGISVQPETGRAPA